MAAGKRPPAFEINLSEEFPHLAHAPIVEAMLIVKARSERSLESIDAQLELAKRLPDYAELTGIARDEVDSPYKGGYRVRFWTADNRRIIEFDRDGVTFNRLAPYADWQDFFHAALQAWKAHSEVAQPSEIQKMRLRFLNLIPINNLAEIRQVLAVPAHPLEKAGLPRVDMLNASTHEVPGHPFQIDLYQSVQTHPSSSGSMGLIIQIDVSTTQPIDAQEDVLKAQLGKMRWLKNKSFFSLLTTKGITRLQRASP